MGPESIPHTAVTTATMAIARRINPFVELKR
jgi:hypothetical protein